MKTRKLRLVALLVAAMCLLIAGCTDTGIKDNTEKEKLLIGSDIYSPYFYLDDNGDFAGIDVEIATEACRRLGLAPVFIRIEWQNKAKYLADHTIDCLWGSFSMNGREDDYLWAGPYLSSRQVVVVNAASNIYSLSDLSGMRVAVQNGTKPESIFLTNAIKDVCVYKVYSFTNIANVFSALKNGYVDACAGHETAYRDYIKNTEGSYRILDEALLTAKLGVAFEKHTDREKAEKLSAVLEEMRADGTIRNILEQYDLDVDFALNGGDVQ